MILNTGTGGAGNLFAAIYVVYKTDKEYTYTCIKDDRVMQKKARGGALFLVPENGTWIVNVNTGQSLFGEYVKISDTARAVHLDLRDPFISTTG